eukprot:CFRG2409T1
MRRSASGRHSMSGDRKKMNIIRPYRGYQANVGVEQAENSWRLLKSAIEKIHIQDASGLSYEELYRNAYNMVLHKHGALLYKGLVDVVTEHLAGVSKAVAAAAENGAKVDFLPSLNSQWKLHRTSMFMVRDILMYLDKQYVSKQNDRSIVSVYELGLQLFREQVIEFPQNKTFIKECLLEMIERERSNELTDRSLFKDVLEMLMEVGVCSTQVYEDVFETPFLQKSTAHYTVSSREFLGMNDGVTYVRKVEKWLMDELGLVDAMMDKQTRSRLQSVIEAETITNHLKSIVSMEKGGVVNLLSEHRLKPLQELFNVLKRVPRGTEEIRVCLLEHLKKIGTRLVDSMIEPLPFIEQLIDLKLLYYNTVMVAFDSQTDFTDGVQKCFSDIVNQNKRTPEYLSLYLDDALRKRFRTMTDKEVEDTLKNSLGIFRFLEEKDLFERYYKIHLAKRLLGGKTTNEEYERTMVTKLKTESGTHYTSKLDQMFKDMSISEEINKEYANYAVTQTSTTSHATEGKSEDLSTPPLVPKMNFEVKVVTLGAWPVSDLPSCILPSEFERARDGWESFYAKKHSGRKLMWAYNHGTVEIMAKFNRNKHTLVMTTMQGVIMSLFNSLAEGESYTYEELLSQTGAPEADLKRALQSLACNKSRVLTKTPKKSREINPGDEFSVFLEFKSKFHTIRIPNMSAPSQESGPTNEKTRQTITENRKHMVDAAVVRVMKSRKTHRHSDLVRDVTQALQMRFVPTPVMIKTRIEYLIEREYLKRSPQDHSVYNYVA